MPRTATAACDWYPCSRALFDSTPANGDFADHVVELPGRLGELSRGDLPRRHAPGPEVVGTHVHPVDREIDAEREAERRVGDPLLAPLTVLRLREQLEPRRHDRPHMGRVVEIAVVPRMR